MVNPSFKTMHKFKTIGFVQLWEIKILINLINQDNILKKTYLPNGYIDIFKN